MSKTITVTIRSRVCPPGNNNNNDRSQLTFLLLTLLITLLPSPSLAFPTQLSSSSSSSSWDAAFPAYSLDNPSIRRQHRRQISSSFSSDDAAFPVDNSRPPTITRQHRRQDVIFDAREDLLLICDAVGVPAVYYEWRKNGAVLNIDKHPNASLALGRGDLIIKNPGVLDDGYYQCTASNKVGTSLSNVFNVRSAFLDQMPKVTSPKVRAGKVGSHVTLTCSTPHSLPEAEIFWTHDGEDSGFEAMQMTETLAMDPKGNLHFLQLSPEDENDGWPYTCNILNKIMRSIQQGDDQIIELTDNDDVKDVKDAAPVPATLLYAPDPATFALRGSTLKLKCIFAGNPIPEILWKRDGQLIDSSSSSFSPNSHLYISNHNRILAIRNVQPDDAGIYECIGANDANSAGLSATTAVTVEAAPFFISKPEDVEVAEDETASISCEAEGIPAPEVRMLRNGMPIEDILLDTRYDIEVDGKKITIQGLLKGVDDAVYQCNASNIHGYAFADATFRVLAIPPSFMTRPAEEAATIEGRRRTEIPCHAYGVPAPEITWFFTREDRNGSRGTELIEIDGETFISSDAGLTIVDATPVQAGVYTCHAENKFGAIEYSAALRVYESTRAEMAPRNLTVRVHEIVHAKPEVRLDCRVSHDKRLKADIDWERDEKPMSADDGPFVIQTNVEEEEETSSSTTTIVSTLLISPQRGVGGSYSCVAHTDFDASSTTTDLKIFDVPSTPLAPEIMDCRKRAVNLTLIAGNDDGGAEIEEFVLLRRLEGDEGEWEEDRRIVPSAPDSSSLATANILIDADVLPFHAYAFRVAAVNKFGVSRHFSPPSICETPPDVPGANPSSLYNVEGVAPDQLSVRWFPVLPEMRNGPEFKYVVKYRRQTMETEGEDWITEEVVKEEEEGWSVSGLPEPYSPYDVVVVAFNVEGQSEAVPAMTTAWTGEGIPEVAPEEFVCGVNVAETTPTTTLCTWAKYREEELNGKPAGFRLYHWVAGRLEETKKFVDFDFDAVEGRVDELTPFAVNKMQLTARNGAFESAASRTEELETPEGTPGPVGMLEATPVGEDRMKVSWLPPSEPNGLLLGYKLSLVEIKEDADTADIASPLELVVDSTTLQLDSLKPSQRYRIIVTASTAAGEGEGNFVEETSTVLIAPDAPTLTLLGHDERSINMTLSPAASANPGADFFIEYKDSYDTEWRRTDSFQTDSPHFVSLSPLPAGTLYSIRGVSSNGAAFETRSGFNDDDSDLLVTTSGDGPDTREALLPLWLIILVIVVFLLLLILILICCIRRNRGGKYAVQKKEREAGYNNIGIADEGSESKEPQLHGGGLQDGEFHLLKEEEEEELENKFRGSQLSLASSTRKKREEPEEEKEGERDEDSLIAYNLDPGVDVSKFNEDGSFIGLYGKNRPRGGVV